MFKYNSQQQVKFEVKLKTFVDKTLKSHKTLILIQNVHCGGLKVSLTMHMKFLRVALYNYYYSSASNLKPKYSEL